MAIGVVGIQSSAKKEITVIPPSGFPFTSGSAREGTSIDSTGRVVLGQTVGQVGNPALIDTVREVPFLTTGLAQINYISSTDPDQFTVLQPSSYEISGSFASGNVPTIQLQTQDGPFLTIQPDTFGVDSFLFTGCNILKFDALNFMGGASIPTARVHCNGSNTNAGSAPLKFNSGTLMTIPEAGAFEFNGSNLFFTPSGVRKYLVYGDTIAPPGTSVGAAIVNFYGTSATNFLGDPAAWFAFVRAGVGYKIPLYT